MKLKKVGKGNGGSKQAHPLHFAGVTPEANVPSGHDIAEYGHRKLTGSLLSELQGKGEMSNSYGQNQAQGKSGDDETMQPSTVGPQQSAKKYRGY